MSVYKVERKVDTVIIEMDISDAEMLAEVLALVRNETRMAKSMPWKETFASILGEFNKEETHIGIYGREYTTKMVRSPSPLYQARVQGDEVVVSDVIP